MVPLPPRIWPLAHIIVPEFVTIAAFMSLRPPPPITRTVLLAGMVTTAPFHRPPTQVKLPWMTFAPTRLPLFSQVLVPVTVPFTLKPPTDKTVRPNLFVVT